MPCQLLVVTIMPYYSPSPLQTQGGANHKIHLTYPWAYLLAILAGLSWRLFSPHLGWLLTWTANSLRKKPKRAIIQMALAGHRRTSASWGSRGHSVVPHKLCISRLAGLGGFFTMTAKCKGATLAFVGTCVTILTVNASPRAKPKSEGRHHKGPESVRVQEEGAGPAGARALGLWLCVCPPLAPGRGHIACFVWTSEVVRYEKTTSLTYETYHYYVLSEILAHGSRIY